VTAAHHRAHALTAGLQDVGAKRRHDTSVAPPPALRHIAGQLVGIQDRQTVLCLQLGTHTALAARDAARQTNDQHARECCRLPAVGGACARNVVLGGVVLVQESNKTVSSLRQKALGLSTGRD
jgi:hypothetical protein